MPRAYGNMCVLLLLIGVLFSLEFSIGFPYPQVEEGGNSDLIIE